MKWQEIVEFAKRQYQKSKPESEVLEICRLAREANEIGATDVLACCMAAIGFALGEDYQKTYDGFGPFSRKDILKLIYPTLVPLTDGQLTGDHGYSIR